MAGRLEVLLHALVVVNLSGDWDGHGLAIVTGVTRQAFTEPAEEEGGREKESEGDCSAFNQ